MPNIVSYQILLQTPTPRFLKSIILFTFIGKQIIPPLVSSVQKDSPAEIADIKKDDKILKINNNNINDFNDIRKYVYLSKIDFINFEILRDNKIIVKNIKPIFCFNIHHN